MSELTFNFATDWKYVALYLVLYVLSLIVIYRCSKMYYSVLMARKLRKNFYPRAYDLSFSAQAEAFIFFDILAMGAVPTLWVIRQINISGSITFFVWSFFVVMSIALVFSGGFVALVIRIHKEVANADYRRRLLNKVYGPIEEDDEEEENKTK